MKLIYTLRLVCRTIFLKVSNQTTDVMNFFTNNKDVIEMKKISNDEHLTLKQKRFVQEYLVDLNATQAAIRSGYSKKTANQQGPRLLVNVGIQGAIQKAQKSISERNEITVDKLLADLEETRKQSMKKKQYGWALRALELMGKHIGMFKENINYNMQNCGAIRDLEGEEDNLIHFPKKKPIGAPVDESLLEKKEDS